MKGITHKQAKRNIRANLDGLLTDSQRHILDAHLSECRACRAESETLSTLTRRLQSGFHDRWDAQRGPSPHVMTNIQSQIQRIIMSNRINVGLRALTGIAILLVLAFVLNYIIQNLRFSSSSSEPAVTNSSFNSEEQHGGLIAFVSERDGNSEIYVMKTDGSGQINLTNDLAADDSPVWSPDGERLAFISNRNGSPQIYAMNPDGSNLIQITDYPDTESWSDLDWSPDGRYLAASHTPIESKRTYPDNGHINIYLINADGSGVIQLTENEAGVDYSPNWSPNGDWIAFIRFEFNLTQIYAIRPDETGMVNLSKSARNDFTFDWSPDSSRIMYFSSPTHCFPNDCPTNELRTVQADGANRTTLSTLTDLLPSNIERMRWSPDGTRLFIVTLDFDGMAHFYIVSNDGSNLTRLGDSSGINNTPGRIPQAHWSPDGLFIIYDSDKTGNKDIYTLNVNEVLHTPNTEPLKLTSSSADDYSPVWQPQP